MVNGLTGSAAGGGDAGSVTFVLDGVFNLSTQLFTAVANADVVLLEVVVVVVLATGAGAAAGNTTVAGALFHMAKAADAASFNNLSVALELATVAGGVAKETASGAVDDVDDDDCIDPVDGFTGSAVVELTVGLA
jgi:hypothetical protein